MYAWKNVGLTVGLGALLLGITACGGGTPATTPAATAGDAMKATTDKAGEAATATGDAMKDGADKVGEAVTATGDAMKDGANKVADEAKEATTDKPNDVAAEAEKPAATEKKP